METIFFMSWKGQPRGCREIGAAGRPKSVSRHAFWCSDMGGSFGGRDMVLASRPEASLWAKMGSQYGN